MKAKVLHILAATACLMFASCSEIEQPEVKPTPEQPEAPGTPDDETQPGGEQGEVPELKFSAAQQLAVDNILKFSFDLNRVVVDNFDYVYESNTTGNYSISPISLIACGSLLANGADGDTPDKMAKALGFENIEDMNTVVSQLLRILPDKSQGSTVVFTNSVWVNHLSKPAATYTNKMSELFSASVTTLDFTDPNSVNIINDWCNRSTNGMIPKLVNSLNPLTLAAFANAMYFEGAWDSKFDADKTTTEQFVGRDGSSDVDMMHQEFNAEYAANDFAEMLSIDYSGQGYVLDVVLPKGGIASETIDFETYKSLRNAQRSYEVNLSLPRFKDEADADLNTVMAALGFPMNDYTMETLGIPVINEVAGMQAIQKTAIDVNEEGSKAAAATFFGPFTSEFPGDNQVLKVDFTVNRPFFYVLRNNYTNVVLLMGCVNNL